MKLTEVQEEVECLKTQMHSLSELNTEMKLLLEQRASRIQHLERTLHKHDQEQCLPLSSVVNIRTYLF